DKEGTLYVTDKRILLVHAGTTSIRFDKILDVELDYDRNLLAITKDGSSTPLLITTPDCVKAGTTIAAAAGHAQAVPPSSPGSGHKRAAPGVSTRPVGTLATCDWRS